MSTSSNEIPVTQDTSNIKDEIVSEINKEAIGFVDDHGSFTALEWADKLKFGNKKTQRILNKKVSSGEMICFKLPIVDVTGRKNYTYVYKALVKTWCRKKQNC